MKNKKIIILSLVFLLIIAVSFFIFNGDKKNEKNIVEKKYFDCESVKYSRISFFNTEEDRVSLNIPESWEGNYRLKEEGNRAMFYFLNDDGSANKIFSINKEKTESDDVICKKGDLKYTLNIYDLKPEENYLNIVDTLDCVISSIKCY